MVNVPRKWLPIKIKEKNIYKKALKIKRKTELRKEKIMAIEADEKTDKDSTK